MSYRAGLHRRSDRTLEVYPGRATYIYPSIRTAQEVVLEVLDCANGEDTTPLIQRSGRDTGTEQQSLHDAHVERVITSAQSHRTDKMLHRDRPPFQLKDRKPTLPMSQGLGVANTLHKIITSRPRVRQLALVVSKVFNEAFFTDEAIRERRRRLMLCPSALSVTCSR